MALLRFLADPMSDLRAAAFCARDSCACRTRALRASRRISPARLSMRRSARRLPLARRRRSRGAARLRAARPRWLAWVDRMPPWELLDAVLAETAYAFETRGPAERQARENLKKLRAMIRRFQNRGYATLARIADHLEQLAVGDESNAAIDAHDAVSLMTVHAAKGLEFPIVFVVNMGRGTGGSRRPDSGRHRSRGEPAIAVADFQSEADEETQAREREETKRLLYVAMTRARERLYLSATVKNGVCRPGRGSLGDVMPRSLVDLFVNVPVGRAPGVVDVLRRGAGTCCRRSGTIRPSRRASWHDQGRCAPRASTTSDRSARRTSDLRPRLALVSASSCVSPITTIERSGCVLPGRTIQAIQWGPRASLRIS